MQISFTKFHPDLTVMFKILLEIYFLHSEKYSFQHSDCHEPGIRSVTLRNVTQIGQDIPTVNIDSRP